MSPSILCFFLSISIINSFASICPKYPSEFTKNEIALITCGLDIPNNPFIFYVKLVKYSCDLGVLVFSLDTPIFKTYPNATAVDISCLGIEAISSGVCESIGVNVVRLDASSNKLSLLASANFQCLPNLREINLSKNNITVLDPEIFLKFKHLVKLDLSYNDISLYNPFFFEKSTNLKFMNLKCNPFTIFNPEILKLFPTVKIIVHVSFSSYFPKFECFETMDSTCDKNSNDTM